MARIGRVLYDGAYYHIINRGHDKQFLFKEEKDFIKFKEIIAAYLKKYDFRIFHYCFMGNHFHMLIQVMKGLELPHIMKGLSISFVNYYKRKYRKVGYIFQSRYKSLLIEKEEYLLECARYIERNPLRAKIVTDLSKYRWSSYNYYAQGKKDAIITSNPLYDSFGNTQKEKIRGYIKYVNQPRPYEALLDVALIYKR